MASFNRVILMGNLTADPEIRYTPSGTAVGDLRMAVNRKYKTADGETHEEACFVSVTVWGNQAENCEKYLSKGRPVLVEGRLKLDQWEKDGQKFSKLSVVAQNVQFLGSAQSSEYSGNTAGSSAPTQNNAAEPPQQPAPKPEPGNEPQPEIGNEPQPESQDNALAGDDDNLPF